MRPKHSWYSIHENVTAAIPFSQPPRHCRWKPKVRTISSTSGAGIEQLWADACLFRERGGAGIKDVRGQQRGYWMWAEACGMLERSLKTSLRVQQRAQELQVGCIWGRACILFGAESGIHYQPRTRRQVFDSVAYYN
jgi:putative protein kinase ArgK-like GTPase of G3E family